MNDTSDRLPLEYASDSAHSAIEPAIASIVKRRVDTVSCAIIAASIDNDPIAVMIVSDSPAALSWSREFIVLAVMFGASDLLWLAASAGRNKISEAQRDALGLDQ